MGIFKIIKKSIIKTVKEMGKPLKSLNDSITHQIHISQKKAERKRKRKKK